MRPIVASALRRRIARQARASAVGRRRCSRALDRRARRLPDGDVQGAVLATSSPASRRVQTPDSCRNRGEPLGTKELACSMLSLNRRDERSRGPRGSVVGAARLQPTLTSARARRRLSAARHFVGADAHGHQLLDRRQRARRRIIGSTLHRLASFARWGQPRARSRHAPGSNSLEADRRLRAPVTSIDEPARSGTHIRTAVACSARCGELHGRRQRCRRPPRSPQPCRSSASTAGSQPLYTSRRQARSHRRSRGVPCHRHRRTCAVRGRRHAVARLCSRMGDGGRETRRCTT